MDGTQVCVHLHVQYACCLGNTRLSVHVAHTLQCPLPHGE